MTRPFDETVIDRLQKDREFAAGFAERYKEMMDILQCYRVEYPAFKLTPVGAEGSLARAEQGYRIALEQRADRILGGEK